MPRTKNQTIPLNVKEALIEAGDNWKTVAQSFLIPIDTAQKILKSVSGPDGLIPGTGCGGKRHSKISPPMMERAVELIEDRPSLTLKEIGSQLVQDGFPSVHTSTLERSLHNCCVRLKKYYGEPERRNSPETKQKRKVFATFMLQNHPHYHKVWVDEQVSTCSFRGHEVDLK